ncbi:hypothetical protein HPB50_019085 [Hyalomma asiaticum]|uniref:Uncharacterized protein n=1 Tax=Hyalomma asiaticum TaxID=266040 RepID=A0ACB7RQM3_HYAAI|nr:hypothetical protein HPB50_019085 [Hyalomma asiaticum]
MCVRAFVRALDVLAGAADRGTRTDRYAAGSGPRPAACVTQISSRVSPSSRGWDRRSPVISPGPVTWVVLSGALPSCEAEKAALTGNGTTSTGQRRGL